MCMYSVHVVCVCAYTATTHVHWRVFILCRRILDDLSSADASLKASADPLALAAAATLQAQQVVVPVHLLMFMHSHIAECTFN